MGVSEVNPTQTHTLKEGKFQKRKGWCGFQRKGEQKQQASFAWHTRNRVGLDAQPLSDGRNRGKEERRETESNLKGLVLRGDLRGKRPRGRASWKSGPVQGQKRTGALGQGRGTLSHCPGQAQSLVGLLQQEDTE